MTADNYSLDIRSASPGGRVLKHFDDDIELIASALNIDGSVVRRWRLPKESGGTGGIIAAGHQTKLSLLAAQLGNPFDPTIFLWQPGEAGYPVEAVKAAVNE